MRFIPFVYLGAKHMVTGYDHLLFLLGVIFFLYRLKDVAVYVTLFALGHSVTLLAGVLTGAHVSAAMGYWRRTASFARHAAAASVAIMVAGFALIAYQLTGYFTHA